MVTRISSQSNKINKPSNSFFSTFILRVSVVLLLLVGLLLATYPFYMQGLNNLIDQKKIEYYQRMANEKEKKKKAGFEDYNQSLKHANGTAGEDPFQPEVKENFSDKIYQEHFIGKLLVEKLSISIPLFDETNDQFLDQGASLLKGTSYPIGGAGTHAVLSAHRGLPERRLFSDLDRLEKGDTFILNIHNRNLAYEVDRIKVVEPDDTSLLKIEAEKDFVTLLTCTPYMINSHRLLVRGKRVPYIGKMSEKFMKEQGKQEKKDVLIICLTICLFFVAGVCLYRLFKVYRISQKYYDLAISSKNEAGFPRNNVRYALYDKSGKKVIRRNQKKVCLRTNAKGRGLLRSIPGGQYTLIEIDTVRQSPIKIGVKKSKHRWLDCFPSKKQKTWVFKKGNVWIIQRD